MRAASLARNAPRLAIRQPSSLTSPQSPGEEALGEGGDEGDFDEQANDGLPSCQPRERVAQPDARREEAAPMEAAYAEYQRLVPRKVWSDEVRTQQIETHKGEDNGCVGEKAAERPIAIAREHVQKERAEVGQPLPLSP